MSSDLFGPIFVPAALRRAVDGRAWLAAMLEAERALTVAGARAGVVPGWAAEEISGRCEVERFDVEEIGARGRDAGNPVPALVKALAAEVSKEAARYVHLGATSQDITDTASMLVARGALDQILPDLDALAAAGARLADEHRTTLMVGRSLMQQALPTTFGLKAAVWLVSLVEARVRLREVRRSGLAVQLGGAAGTLASLGGSGTSILGEFAAELGLAEPAVPWHADRTRVADLGSALALCAGAARKIALDVVLMSQTEVGEVAEPSGGGRGGSSTLPHKRNPVGSVLAIACARRVPPLAATLYDSMAGEHERAAGAWHAEWETMSDALALTGGALAATREVLEGLEVSPERMRENLDATGGLVLAERVTTVAAEKLGRLEAHEIVERASHRTYQTGRTLREELLEEPALRDALPLDRMDEVLDPAGYLGSANVFVDRALETYRKEEE